MIVYLTVPRLLLTALQLRIMGFKVNKLLTVGFRTFHQKFFVIVENYSTCLLLIFVRSES
jgi:hypothetical protein